MPVALTGLAIVAVLVGIGTRLNAGEAELKNFPGNGTAITGRDQLAAAGISPGVMKPFDILVEKNGNADEIAAKVREVPGVAAAVAPEDWHRGSDSLVQAFPAIDGSAPGIQGIIDRANPPSTALRAVWAAPRRSTATSPTRSTRTSHTCCCSCSC